MREVPDDIEAMPRVLLTGFCAVPGPRRAGVQLLFAAALAEAGVKDVTYVNIGTDMQVATASLGNGSIDVDDLSTLITNWD